jgi:hypothetical protein
VGNSREKAQKAQKKNLTQSRKGENRRKKRLNDGNSGEFAFLLFPFATGRELICLTFESSASAALNAEAPFN